MIDREDEDARDVRHTQVVAIHGHLVAKVDGVRAQLLLLRSDSRQAERLGSAARGYSLCIASPNPDPNPDLDEEAES